MSFETMLSALNISASGMSAERLRMEVVANNVANAFSTRTPAGGPFRRKDVVFATVLKDQVRAKPTSGKVPASSLLGGVKVDGIVDDISPFQVVYNPGHPDADAFGYVLFPNVQLPIEMVNLITANRAYEANLKVLQSYRQEAEQALLLVRT